MNDFPDNRKQGALGGTVLRGPDGALYFVRDEMLTALRVEGEGKERLEDALKKGSAHVEIIPPDPKATGNAVRPAAYVRGSLLREDPRNMDTKLLAVQQRVVASTIMCPWFC